MLSLNTHSSEIKLFYQTYGEKNIKPQDAILLNPNLDQKFGQNMLDDLVNKGLWDETLEAQLENKQLYFKVFRDDEDMIPVDAIEFDNIRMLPNRGLLDLEEPLQNALSRSANWFGSFIPESIKQTAYDFGNSLAQWTEDKLTGLSAYSSIPKVKELDEAVWQKMVEENAREAELLCSTHDDVEENTKQTITTTSTSYLDALLTTTWNALTYAANNPFKTLILALAASSIANRVHLPKMNFENPSLDFTNGVSTAANILTKLAVAKIATNRMHSSGPVSTMIAGMSLWNGVEATGPEFQVNTYTTTDQAFSSVASFADANFVVTWGSSGQDGSGYGVYGQRFNATGAKLGSEFRVNTHTTNSQSNPSVASLMNDSFIVTWYSDVQDGSGYGVYGQRFNATGAKVGLEFQVNTYTTNNQNYPSVASFADGSFVVMWQSDDQDGAFYGVYGQRFNATGSKLGSEFQVNTYTTSNQQGPSVASFADGSFVVTWQSNGQDGSLDGAYGQRFNAMGVKVGSEFQVNTYTTSYQQKASVASFVDGSFVVTWGSSFQDGSNAGVYGQRFNATGAKVGLEFQVNTYTTNWQWAPSVATFVDGGFVVTWETNGQDGSSYGVYGRIFTPPRLDNNTLIIYEGQTKLLTSAILSASAPNTIPGTLVFTISNIMNGQFESVSAPGIAIFNFAQQQVTTGQIQFAHDGSEFAPAYQVKVSEVVLETPPVFANIIFTSINDAPMLTGTSGTLNYTEKNSVTAIDPNIVIFDDSLNLANATVRFISSVLAEDVLAFTSQGGISGVYSNLTGILALTGSSSVSNYQSVLRSVTYFNPSLDPSTALRTVTFTVNDGQFNSNTVNRSISVTPVNDPPVLTENKLTISQGGIVILATNQLNAFDPDTPASGLTFTASNIQRGSFSTVGSANNPITVFTLQSINSGIIQFIQDGSENAPAYDISVSDSSYTTNVQAAIIAYTNINQAPVVINIIPDRLSEKVDQAFSFQVATNTFFDSDPGDQAALVYSSKLQDGNALPTWISFDAANRQFRGTPINAGHFRVSVFAKDPSNAMAVANFSLAVNPAFTLQDLINLLASLGSGLVGGAGAMAIAYYKLVIRHQDKYPLAIRVAEHLKLSMVYSIGADTGLKFATAIDYIRASLSSDELRNVSDKKHDKFEEAAKLIADGIQKITSDYEPMKECGITSKRMKINIAFIRLLINPHSNKEAQSIADAIEKLYQQGGRAIYLVNGLPSNLEDYKISYIFVAEDPQNLDDVKLHYINYQAKGELLTLTMSDEDKNTLSAVLKGCGTPKPLQEAITQDEMQWFWNKVRANDGHAEQVMGGVYHRKLEIAPTSCCKLSTAPNASVTDKWCGFFKCRPRTDSTAGSLQSSAATQNDVPLHALSSQADLKPAPSKPALVTSASTILSSAAVESVEGAGTGPAPALPPVSSSTASPALTSSGSAMVQKRSSSFFKAVPGENDPASEGIALGVLSTDEQMPSSDKEIPYFVSGAGIVQ